METKKCKYCMTEIDKKAKVCPNCKRTLKSKGCLIPCLIIFLIFIGALIFGIIQIVNNPDKYASDRIANKYIDVTVEEGKNIDSILNQCGISKVKSFEHDELLDDIHSEGESGYRISINNNIKNIILYLNADKTVYSLSYNTYNLYNDNKVIASLQDYTFSNKEESDLMIKCQEKVKETLKSPSSAEFPNILEWKFSKEKNIVTVQGYVDAQNDFGTVVRSSFQFIIDTKSDTITSFIFDGKELIK